MTRRGEAKAPDLAPDITDEFIRHCRERIAAYKRPKAVIFVDSLPRNANGKILKNELKKLFEEPADA